MKKLIAASCLAACLALAVPAIAAVQTFGPDACRFTLDVPDGWVATPRDDGCKLVSADGKTAFTLQVRSSDGKSSAEIAKKFVQAMSKEGPEYKLLGIKDEAPDRSAVEYEVEVDKVKARLVVKVVVVGERSIIVMYTGSDEQGIADILKTVKDVQ